MKVVQVVPFVSPRFGGPPIVADAYVEGMLELGLDVEVITTIGPGEDDEFRNAGLFQRCDETGNLHCLQRSWPHGWFNARGMREAITRSLSRSDICHLQMLWDRPHVLAAKYAKRFGVPYIITPHGLLEPWRLARKWLKKKLFMTLLGSRILRNSSCLHALCEQEVRSFRLAGYEGPVCVIPNGVNATLVAEGGPTRQEDYEAWPQFKDKRLVLFMSRLDMEKGLDNLVNAWSEIHSDWPDVIIGIAGPDNRGYGLTVKEMVQEKGLADSIHILGHVYGGKKLSLMRIAEAFILPSYSEGFSMAILEALAMGIPSIITPGCNFPEAPLCGAALEAQPNSESVAEVLMSLLSKSRGELDTMGQRGQKLIIENYTWDICVRKMLTVYDCILNDKEIPLYPSPFSI